jgi:hypothetical protein
MSLCLHPLAELRDAASKPGRALQRCKAGVEAWDDGSAHEPGTEIA